MLGIVEHLETGANVVVQGEGKFYGMFMPCNPENMVPAGVLVVAVCLRVVEWDGLARCLSNASYYFLCVSLSTSCTTVFIHMSHNVLVFRPRPLNFCRSLDRVRNSFSSGVLF